MKKFKYITIIMAVFAVFSCKKYKPMQLSYEPLDMSEVTSIKDFIDECASQLGDMFPVRPNSGETGIYSVDTIPQNGKEFIIAGRIISDDSQGNYYKAIAIQDLTNPNYAIKISIDASGVGAWFPIGCVISVRCNGLAIGKYADMYQLGTVYFNNNNDAAKKGYEPGRIPMPIFKTRTKIHSAPEIDKIVVDTLTIAQINQAATNRTLHSRIVCIKDAYFTGEGTNNNQPSSLSDAEKIFAPTTNGVGYPQSRVIRDATGWTVIATSEYARFCNVKLPASEYKGNITAIVGWYKDRYDRTGGVQLTICTLDNLALYHNGERWQP